MTFQYVEVNLIRFHRHLHFLGCHLMYAAAEDVGFLTS